jgi:hypothetical protein
MTWYQTALAGGVAALFLGLSDGVQAGGPCADPAVETAAGPLAQAAAWTVTIPYTAVKGLVALAGGVVSIPVYILSLKNERLTRAVWLPAVSGTFVLTPAHLTGAQPINFWPTCPDG